MDGHNARLSNWSTLGKRYWKILLVIMDSNHEWNYWIYYKYSVLTTNLIIIRNYAFKFLIFNWHFMFVLKYEINWNDPMMLAFVWLVLVVNSFVLGQQKVTHFPYWKPIHEQTLKKWAFPWYIWRSNIALELKGLSRVYFAMYILHILHT